MTNDVKHYKCSYSDLIEVSKLMLIQNPKNNNKHSRDQIDRLAKIIDFQGQRAPIVISKRSGFITKGHGRLMAIEKLGWDKAAVDFQNYVTEAEEFADMTADNEIARWAELDREKMLSDLDDLDLGDIDFLGLKDFVVDVKDLNEFEPTPLDIESNGTEENVCPHCGEKL